MTAHLPRRSDRRTTWTLLALSVLGTRVNNMNARADIDPSWMVGLNHAATHGFRFGSDVVFTYGPLSYLVAPLSLSRGPMLMGIVWALAVSAATQSALWILTRRIPSTALRLGLCAGAVLGSALIYPPELSLLAYALWVLVLIDLGLDTIERPERAIAALGVFAAVLTLAKFSLAFSVVLLVGLCLSRTGAAPYRTTVARRLGVGAGSFTVGLVGLWVIIGQRLGDLPTWLADSAAIATGYSADGAFHHVDSLSGLRILGLLVATITLLTVLVGRPINQWWRTAPRRVAPLAPHLVIAATVWFFAKQLFVRFTVPNSSVFGALCVLAVAAIPRHRTTAWRAVMPAALVFGTLSQSLPPVRTEVDTWLIPRVRTESLVHLADGLHQLLSPSHHRSVQRRAWDDVITDFSIPADEIRARVGDATVGVEPTDISAVFALGLTWSPLYTLQTYPYYSPGLDQRNADRLAGPDAPQFILARYVNPDNRNQLWTSPQYQLTMQCTYVLDSEPAPWKLFRRAGNVCGQPVQINQVTVRKNQPVTTPFRPGSIVYATFDYDTGLADKLATAALRPLRTPRVRLDAQLVRLITGLAGQPHIVSQPAQMNGRPTPWGAITYTEMEFIDIPGDITVTFWELPVTPG